MRLSRALVLGAVLCAATAAQAQVRPKILIIFDTSGSMLRNSSQVEQNGDGSALCTNDGQTSRVYLLKKALFEVLQGMGAKEVDFALQTFPMFVGPTRTPYCATNRKTCTSSTQCRTGETCSSSTTYCWPTSCCVTPCETSTPTCSGHYYQTSATVSEIYSGYYGCRVSGHTSPSTQTNANCGDTSNPCSAWYTSYLSEALKVPFLNTTPEAVMIYFDQQEDSGSVTALTNPEVRVAWSWFTPLGKSLFYAHGYFHKDVLPKILSYEKPCTKLVIAFLTDGDETCNDSTSNPFYPTTWATNLYTNLGVVTHTIGVDASSAGNTLQAIATAGKGNYYQVTSDTNGVKQAFLDIIAKALPPSEMCNGKDDDCDQAIDEDFPKGQACDNGQLGVCYKTGVYVCKTDGTGVECSAGTVTPGTETCNGLDDDCDGQVDEGLICPAPCVPQPEICNNVDDDCDKTVDEGFVSSKCGKNLGECTQGDTQCTAGKINCVGGTGPTTEACNGKDDDCDGTRDGMTESCYTFATGCTKNTSTGLYVCKGYCKPGTKTCTATLSGTTWSGVWGSCLGEQGPGTEVCDGQDNDCDGVVDNSAACPTAGSTCIEGKCSQPCSGAEFSCPKGQLCKNGWCVPDPCDATSCAAKGWVCRGGVCTDPCQGVTCVGYEVCVKGVCVDNSCYNPAKKCPSGQTCVLGKCVSDPCTGVKCGVDEYCYKGQCVDLCDTITCADGETCQLVQEGSKWLAKCVEDPCWDQQCGDGFACIDGKCVADPCNTKTCAKGEVCIKGKCVKDPCDGVICPTSFKCKYGMCLNQNVTTTTELLATGAGGCACAIPSSGGEEPPLGWLLLAILFGLIRKARRD